MFPLLVPLAATNATNNALASITLNILDRSEWSSEDCSWPVRIVMAGPGGHWDPLDV